MTNAVNGAAHGHYKPTGQMWFVDQTMMDELKVAGAWNGFPPRIEYGDLV